MHFLTSIALALFTTAVVIAAPTTDVNLKSRKFPVDKLTNMLDSHSDNTAIDCLAGNNNCGVVTFESGQYTTFGQGICMQLGSNVQSIYVAKCYCSLWNSCTGKSAKDIFVGGMMMCEKPRTMDTFDKAVKYISCGGMN